MTIKKAKHTIIIDADLHIQDPHEIILSYFNTHNDNPVAHGEKSSFKMRVLGIFVLMVVMKFFFAEMLNGFLKFMFIVILALIVGVIGVYLTSFFAEIFNRSIKRDNIRGFFFQVVFITLCVIVLGSLLPK
jgi:hypothetical protein